MYTYIAKAIEAGQEIVITLLDGSKISGLPSWGEDRTGVNITTSEKMDWIPFNEIGHVKTLLNRNAKKPADE
ncbi:hypothetical protein [Paenibacillus sp. DYY-L-2]|uniref:hypothetical protein n=1 Tax=Paenibacillus sp. DYY-L-2 TaxID=3447013 RepID=UPI003F5048CA